MKVVIIEDERLVAENLAKNILKIDSNIQILAILHSVEKATEWFQNNENQLSNINLIFSDIQLTDGLSFEIFKTINCKIPVIFCTTYDKYALNAFETNCIDYILKPFNEKKIETAINKYKSLKEHLSDNIINYDKILELFEGKTNQKSCSVLVNYKSGVKPINLCDIALFYIESGITYLHTLDNKKYTINKTLGEIEEIAKDNFYRVTKQYLINRKIVDSVNKYSENQFSIHLNIEFIEKVTLRKEKINDFSNWLTKK